jgi:EAL and modified HD-GYP domain-containing signal transduction protein
MHSPQLFLGRQPILDREQELLAYELLFRDGASGSLANQAQITSPTHATATVIINTFAELPVNSVLGPYRGFINIDHDLLFSDLIEALPPQSVVLELLEHIEPTPEVIARCRQLKEIGFTLALDDIIHVCEAHHPLFELATIIKVDIMNMEDDFLHTLVQKLKRFDKQLLAEKVENLEQFNGCKEMGFDLFQGYYFAKPTIIVGKKISSSALSLVHLLSLLMEEAEAVDLENAFKAEPGLAINLLRLTNSVSSGLLTQVTSLRHAITILGRQQLRRWLQLLLYTNPEGSKNSSPLLQLAATRGRLMELLAKKIRPMRREFHDQAFMVGIMSLMPTILSMNMEDILSQIPVNRQTRNALTDYVGESGKLLMLAEATESNDSLLLGKALNQFPALDTETLNQCLLGAFSWANNLEREREEAQPIQPVT